MASFVARVAFWRQIYEIFPPIAIAVQVGFLLVLIQVHGPSTNIAFDLPSASF